MVPLSAATGVFRWRCKRIRITQFSGYANSSLRVVLIRPMDVFSRLKSMRKSLVSWAVLPDENNEFPEKPFRQRGYFEVSLIAARAFPSGGWVG